MEPSSSFITFEQLSTFPTQVYAVLLLTQAVKAFWPTITPYALRLTALLVAVDIALGVTFLTGPRTWQAAFLAPLNSIIVWLSALKTAEFIKGTGSSQPPSPSAPPG